VVAYTNALVQRRIAHRERAMRVDPHVSVLRSNVESIAATYQQSAFAKQCLKDECELELGKEHKHNARGDTMNYEEKKHMVKAHNKKNTSKSSSKVAQLITPLLLIVCKSVMYAVLLWSDGTNIQVLDSLGLDYIHEYENAVARMEFGECVVCLNRGNVAHIEWHDVFRIFLRHRANVDVTTLGFSSGYVDYQTVSENNLSAIAYHLDALWTRAGKHQSPHIVKLPLPPTPDPKKFEKTILVPSEGKKQRKKRTKKQSKKQTKKQTKKTTKKQHKKPKKTTKKKQTTKKTKGSKHKKQSSRKKNKDESESECESESHGENESESESENESEEEESEEKESEHEGDEGEDEGDEYYRILTHPPAPTHATRIASQVAAAMSGPRGRRRKK
jgi:hypothetical protein